MLFTGTINLQTPTAIAKQLLEESYDGTTSEPLRVISTAFIGYFFEIESSLTFSFTSIAVASILIAELALREKLHGTHISILHKSAFLEQHSISLRETASCLECYEQRKAEKADCPLSTPALPLRNDQSKSIDQPSSILRKRLVSENEVENNGEVENGCRKYRHPM